MSEPTGAPVLRLVKSFRVRVREGLVAAVIALEDLVGLGGYGLVCWGVYELWGKGWTLLAAGAPLFTFYVWRSVRAARGGVAE